MNDVCVIPGRRAGTRLQRLATMALVAIAACAPPAAFAGIGLAVVLDLPAQITAGESDLDGSITIFSMNSENDQASQNLAFAIAVTPSCGAHALSSECPDGAEDPGVFAIGPVATGRAGTACAGTTFAVTPRNTDTGEVLFDAVDELVVLGSASDAPSARQCTIDFTFSYAGRRETCPDRQRLLKRRGNDRVRAGAGDQRSGTALGHCREHDQSAGAVIVQPRTRTIIALP